MVVAILLYQGHLDVPHAQRSRSRDYRRDSLCRDGMRFRGSARCIPISLSRVALGLSIQIRYLLLVDTCDLLRNPGSA